MVSSVKLPHNFALSLVVKITVNSYCSLIAVYIHVCILSLIILGINLFDSDYPCVIILDVLNRHFCHLRTSRTILFVVSFYTHSPGRKEKENKNTSVPCTVSSTSATFYYCSSSRSLLTKEEVCIQGGKVFCGRSLN